MRLWTAGTTGRTPEWLIETCKRLGVGLIVDVRPSSDRGPPRWSATEIGPALEIAGMVYLWTGARPLAVADLPRRGETPEERDDRLRRYRERLLTDPAAAGAMASLELRVSRTPPPPSGVLLLGTPAAPSKCHRSVIAARLRERLPQLEIMHL